ncbi:MAG: DUF1800 domain-containing protein [Pirellulaceae bacterium]|jgi:hypothetical protein|nr:DUF1800 domain-containing protein [Pirellulaceae bacterium]MDP7020319.1 DUF1800 domain-containing protein [Pirellulaceae bacterium]
MNLKAIAPDSAWKTWSPSGDDWNRRAAAHLYRRAGFAANSQQLTAALERSPAEIIDGWLGEGEKPEADFERVSTSLANSVLAGGDPQKLGSWWLFRMANSPNQLIEKTTLFWHGHFATSAAKVTDARMMFNQNQMLRRYAVGDFGRMVHEISRDPAMLLYLDSTTNRKAHPNENYARELMELFCLGEGNYTEEDIREIARCFTGWEIRRKKYRFNRYQHDTGDKSFLGATGKLGGEEAVDVVLAQRTAPMFIVKKLIRYFVFDEPAVADELAEPLANELRANDFVLAPTIRRILTSEIFFSTQSVGRKVRSPIELGVGVLRALEGSTNLNAIGNESGEIGQALFFPPNVKGWDGGRTWINSSTLLGRANFVQRLLKHEKTRFADEGLRELTEKHKVRKPTEFVEWLEDLLLARPLRDESRRGIAETVKMNNESTLRDAVYLMSTLPEFQLS